jgi:predicted MFS family arabinose efflux permease
MVSRSKKLFYLFEFSSCVATVYYSNFLFFYLQKVFGFGDFENLLVAALNGIVYVFGSWQGGKFSNKHGPILSLSLGISGMVLALITAGIFHSNIPVQIVAYGVWTIFVSCTWPPLQAIVTNNAGTELSKMVGLYNVTWAGAGALSYFTAGMLLEKLGMQSLFWFPVGIHLLQLTILLPIATRVRKNEDAQTVSVIEIEPPKNPHAKRFLHMAWVANPFSYIAINTLVPLIPSIASQHHLSTGVAGIVCSMWMFARMGAFYMLWKWNGWHYRFRWMVGAFIVLTIAFSLMIMTHSIVILIAAQIGFGLSIGLIYYSSLYYAMHASKERASNGGLHEAMLGTGLFVGPTVGALGLYFLPAAKNVEAFSVNGLLVVGFAALLYMGQFRLRSKSKR